MGTAVVPLNVAYFPWWIGQSVFVVFSVVAGPMANAGWVPESLHWGYPGALIESSLAFCASGLETSVQRL